MAGVLVNGGAPLTMSCDQDEQGYRDYNITFLVETEFDETPVAVLATPGLPVTGSIWSIRGEIDAAVQCTRKRSISIHEERPGRSAGLRPDGTKFLIWQIGFVFTNRPQKNCSDEDFDDPLLAPQKMSGSFLRYSKEATQDRYGYRITTSSHEEIRGPQVEFDETKITCKVEQNVALLNLAQIGAAMQHVNPSTMWGMPARCIKLSTCSWEEKWYGTCQKYFTRSFDFDINPETFDRNLADVGTKVLRGHWDHRASATGTAAAGDCGEPAPTLGTWVLDKIAGACPDAANPTHFIRYKDWNDENTRVVLDGAGKPATRMIRVGTGTGAVGDPGDPGNRIVEKYEEYDLLLLGIPAIIGP